MKNLTIKKYPAPVLRKKAVKIKNPLDLEIQALIPAMAEAMKKENGVGLAAPQIGSSVRLCIVKEENKIYALINPQITAKSTKKIVMEEGCLSFPGTFFPITRPENVKVRFLDEAGAEKKLKAGGLLGRAIQHEIDHLDGILIIDRAKKVKKTKL
jgi:peptide deformylase